VEDIRGKIAQGAAWMIGLKVIDSMLGVASTIILARLLVPSDFGVVAMALSMIALLEVMTAFGFDNALIQRSNVDRSHMDTAWTLNLCFGLGIACLLLALANPASIFYDEPRLAPIMYFLALGWLVSGAENIGVVTFRKEMNFRKEFIFTLLKRMSSFAVTIPLAIILRNYWALAAGIVAGKFLSTTLSYLVHPYRPRPSLAGIQDLIRFSAWIFLTNFANFVAIRLSDFVLGRLSGARALGLYNLSREIGALATSEFVSPINRAAYPGYAKLANDRATLRSVFVEAMGLITFIAIPAGFGVAAVDAPLILLAFGQAWVDAIPIVSILAIYGAATAIASNSGYVYLSIGRPHVLTALVAGHVVLLIPALILMAGSWGAIGAAWAVLIVELVFLPISVAVLLRVLSLPATIFLSAIWRPIAGAAIMFFAVRKVVELVETVIGAGNALQLLSGIATGVVVYFGTVFLLWRL
jgi:O-antigen/teichoic acid export membrane protein